MYINKQKSTGNYFICLILFIMIHIFLLTGCQQEESALEADSSEMQSRAILTDQALISREETDNVLSSTEEMEDELFSAEEKNEESVSAKEGGEIFSAEDRNNEQVSEETGKPLNFDETLITGNMDYFKSLCICVPYFDDIENLDEDFYAILVNMSVCGPLQYRAESVNIESPPYYMAKISRADMEEYTLLLFGKELPAYEPTFQEMLEEERNFYYESGFYYVGWFDYLDIIFTYAGCEWTENGNLIVEFAMSEAVNGKSTVFELAPADNENGFIIVSKKLKVTE